MRLLVRSFNKHNTLSLIKASGEMRSSLTTTQGQLSAPLSLSVETREAGRMVPGALREPVACEARAEPASCCDHGTRMSLCAGSLRPGSPGLPHGPRIRGAPGLLRTCRDPAPSLGCPWNARTRSDPHGMQQTVVSRMQGAGWQAGRGGRAPAVSTDSRGQTWGGQGGSAGQSGIRGVPGALRRRPPPSLKLSVRFLLRGVMPSPGGLFR